MKVKKIYKYGTGSIIPEGAIYLSTIVQDWIETPQGNNAKVWLVWHYFLVEIEEEKKSCSNSVHLVSDKGEMCPDCLGYITLRG